MKAVTIEFEHIGTVLFDPSKRARCLSIYVKTAKSVRVAVPRWVSLAKAKQVVDLRVGWIKKQQRKIAMREKQWEHFDPPAKIDVRQAAMGLIERLNHFAEKHKLLYNRVTIRNQRTRWGSCSSKNNISLNIKLAHLPAELVDYVLLHELTHTKVRNHGRRFWEELAEICPGAKSFNKKLRQYGFLFAEV